MMDLLLATSGGEAQGASGGYVDDVFSAYTYTGNGSTQTINNRIDLAGKGGLVWTKQRNGTNAAYADNILIDTVRGRDYKLHANDTLPNSGILPSHLFESFNTTGYTVNNYAYLNSSNNGFVSWTFRRAPKFFDVVTYTGTGDTPQQIAHSLGVAPGMIIVKATSGVSNWATYHRSLGENKHIWLNSSKPETTASEYWNSTAPTATHFTVSTNNVPNYAGYTYVAYLFAHDPSADGIIQCGSYVGNGSAVGPEINLGWEPQFVLIKSATVHSAGWYLLDSSRGMPTGGNDPALTANSSNAESSFGPANFIDVAATGFQLKTSDSSVNGGGSPTYIYLAIRRSNKPPTSGTQVYNAIARTGTGAAATVTGVGFAPDLVGIQRTNGNPYFFFDRMRGALYGLRTPSTMQDVLLDGNVTVFGQDGIGVGNSNDTNFATLPYINHFFRRAPGFFDVVCYTGTGVAQTVPHSLGVAPELMIVKSRNNTFSWGLTTNFTETQYDFFIMDSNATKNSTANYGTGAVLHSSKPTAASWGMGTNVTVNNSGSTYVAYLFASLPSISKVGSYTGNGTSQTINCGFATGARFILIKRTDATGDWHVWDSVRGIIAANDPHLSLNTTAAEVTTDDSVDPEASGFIVNQNTTTKINVDGGQYIFLAIA